MSFNPLRIAELTDAEQSALNDNLEQLEAKMPRNMLRAHLYDGKHAIRHLGSLIPPAYYQTAVVLGWPAKAVDLLARRCNVDGFVWADGDIDGLGVRELVRENKLRAELNQAFISSLLHSTAFLVATTGGQGEPAGLVHARDALSATGVWSSRRRALTSALTVGEFDKESPARPVAFTLYLDGVTVTCVKDGQRWSVDRSSHGFGVPVEPLPYKPRLGRPFGMSRISRPVISAYRQAVKTAIRMEGGADVFTWPQMILLGADSDVFKNADGSMKPDWQVALGRVFALPDDEDATNPRASVQRFEGASPEPHLKMLKQQAELFAGETSIPITSLGVSTDGNPTSAESYLASREDLVAEAEGATDDWSGPINRTVTRALAMRSGLRSVPPEWLSIEAKFRSPMYTSRAAAADAGSKQIGAVPWLADTEVGLELLGLDEQQIERAMSERRRANGMKLAEMLTTGNLPNDNAG